MPYHLAILHRLVLDREKGKGKVGLEERPVQGREDIASKQQNSPFRTDYNKLATLIETNSKLSAVFACNAMPIKVGEGYLSGLILGLRFIRPKTFSELLEAIERVPNADGDFGNRTDAAGVIGNLMIPGG
ncbi:hypothetical protein M9H77_30901 [Catharanthus roseus]|uniref:Uncharacterized protein n=1 Tax=Catharanthus roseus TaxID=4058 RepID=A0ACC0A0M5_CATRO|nr:hypothetical protein M9H77_30901 [Catharanthus roseus]